MCGDGGIRRRAGGGGGGYRDSEEGGGGLARPKLELNIKVYFILFLYSVCVLFMLKLQFSVSTVYFELTLEFTVQLSIITHSSLQFLHQRVILLAI